MRDFWKSWEPGMPQWKVQSRSAYFRSRAIFIPQFRAVKETKEFEVCAVLNGTGKLPTYYVRRPRPGGPTMPWRKVV